MNKEILYKGVNTTPSANMSIDGDSSMLYNLIPEDNAIKPIMPPKELAHFDNLRQVFIHKNDFTHYIVIQQQGNNVVSLSCYDSQWNPIQLNFMQVQGYKQISAMGNMLIISADNRIYYVLYENQKYNLLGNNIPAVSLSFALYGKVKTILHKDEGPIKALEELKRNGYKGWMKDNFNKLMGFRNTFVKDYAIDKEAFIYPFFIRYAVKLYDGTYTQFSTPVLMIPNAGSVPMLLRIENNILCVAFTAEILMKINENNFGKWKDIIAGVDFFVSKAIYSYNQAEEPKLNSDELLENAEYFSTKTFPKSYGYLCVEDGNPAIHGYTPPSVENDCKKIDINECVKMGASSGNPEIGIINIAEKTKKQIKNELVNSSDFYKVASLQIKELEAYINQYELLEIKHGVLNALYTKETLNDELLASRQLASGRVHEYNNRLHVYDASFIMPQPTGLDKTNQFLSTNNNTGSYEIVVHIKTNQGEKIVRKRVSDNQIGHNWFFYPDNNAYKALILDHNERKAYVMELKRHHTLNGAYWLTDDYNGETTQLTQTDYNIANQDTVDNLVYNPSTIYVSETNNPFSFRSVNTVSVGCNKIYALSSAAKALSQGQFGQFPLYAFTDNGVWALQTNNTGSYSARQPVTRDVCVNAESITQLDSAVLFSTDRGIMLLEGATATCISNAIFGVNTVPITALPQFKHLYAHANLSSSATVPQITDIHDMQYLYDYIHQRIIAYVQSSPVAFVFSIKSKQWGMMQSNFKHSINAYPDTMAITNGNHVITLSDVSYERQLDYIGTQLLVTRPLNVDAQNIFKTVNTVIQRGLFKKGNVMQVLFASNDLLNWVIVWSSTNQYLRGFSGTPYKYYRIALLTTLHANECVTGATVQFLPKLTNQPR